MTKQAKPLSPEKLKILSNEKNTEKLFRFLMDDRADLITFLDNANNYQSDELINLISQNSIDLMGYVIKGASVGKNSWNENKIINWMEENSIDILTIAQTLSVKYASYNLSPKVEDNFFHLVVKDHILYENKLKQEHLDDSDKIIKYQKLFPLAYIKKFLEMDSEVLTNLMKKPVGPSFHMNLAQHIYIHKGQAGKHEDAQEIFNIFTDLILKPVFKNLNGYMMKTDICEYYLKESNQLESWEFFAPMDYNRLNAHQKEVYLATGISHLFNSTNKPLPSRYYSQSDIMNSLMVVPHSRLKYYIDANKIKMPKSTGEELLAMWLKNHLENELGSSPKIKGIKI